MRGGERGGGEGGAEGWERELMGGLRGAHCMGETEEVWLGSVMLGRVGPLPLPLPYANDVISVYSYLFVQIKQNNRC